MYDWGNPGAAGPSVREAGRYNRCAGSTAGYRLPFGEASCVARTGNGATSPLHHGLATADSQPLKLCAAAARPRQAMARPLYSQARLRG